MNEIGEAVKKDDSIECDAKINYVVNEGFQIRTIYEVYAEVRVMEKLNIKCSDEDNSVNGSSSRMIVKRRCNIAKPINKQCERMHQD